MKIILLVLVLLFCSCKDSVEEPDSGLIPVRIKLNWFPEAEHGGYFHGRLSGIYKEAGLDVEIVEGGPGNPVETEVAIGRYEFGIANADKILAVRENGLDVIALLAPFQDSPRVLLVHEKSGVESFADLTKLERLIVNDTKPFYKFLVMKYPELKLVQTVKYSQALFMAEPRSAMQAYINSEPLIMNEKGVAIKILPLSQLGYNPYASVLITNRELLDRKPELVKKMRDATQKAWEEYLQSPKLANDELIKLNPELGGSLEGSVLRMKPLMNARPFGKMTHERWQKLADQMKMCGALKSLPKNLEKAYHIPFVQKKN